MKTFLRGLFVLMCFVWMSAHEAHGHDGSRVNIPGNPTSLSLRPMPLRGPSEVGFVDTLNVPPEMQFSVFGTSGWLISSFQVIEVVFTLEKPTWITEVGGFMNNCVRIVAGETFCAGAEPFAVDIATAAEPEHVLARFELSDDGDPLRVSYEFVRPRRLHLRAGTYLARFMVQNKDDQGMLLVSAGEYRGDPPAFEIFYEAGSTLMNFIDPVTDWLVESGYEPAAVRILGRPRRGK